ncbi:uncharacterized protein [Primulina huaijiensis]|uniref:uncharacterized protein n=1 Tax=Primulina huaijiensis TaxID=1492673 RepID=UPI003CC79B81
MVTSRIVKNLEILYKKDVVRADLIVLPVDSILGIDWLSLNGASIDFRQRSLCIRPPSGKSFLLEAARNKQMPHIISYICAMKLIKRGCQAFLACVTLSPIPDIPKLRGFPNVFPEDVSGIPPNREVEFSIELMSSTIPISKAPYRLASAEIKELKDQIQESLNKGFIRHSCSL